MESLKAHLKARLCHPISDIFVFVTDGNNVNLKRKLDFINYMRTKTKPNSTSENKNKSHVTTLALGLWPK